VVHVAPFRFSLDWEIPLRLRGIFRSIKQHPKECLETGDQRMFAVQGSVPLPSSLNPKLIDDPFQFAGQILKRPGTGLDLFTAVGDFV
jgi:hypothetical protein